MAAHGSNSGASEAKAQALPLGWPGRHHSPRELQTQEPAGQLWPSNSSMGVPRRSAAQAHILSTLVSLAPSWEGCGPSPRTWEVGVTKGVGPIWAAAFLVSESVKGSPESGRPIAGQTSADCEVANICPQSALSAVCQALECVSCSLSLGDVDSRSPTYWSCACPACQGITHIIS